MELVAWRLGDSSAQYSIGYSLVLLIKFYFPFLIDLLLALSILFTVKENTTLVKSTGSAFKIVIAAGWTWFLAAALVIGGLLLMIVPGFFLIISLSLTLVVVVEQGTHGLKALITSLRLIRGDFWTVTWRLIGVSLFLLIIGGIVESLTNFQIFSRYLFTIPLFTLFTQHLYHQLALKKPLLDTTDALGFPNRLYFPVLGLGFLIIVLLFSMVNVLIVFGRDIPPPVNSAFKQSTKVTDQDNAYLVLLEGVENINDGEVIKSTYEQIIQSATLNPQDLEAIISSNRLSLTFFDLAVSKPAFQLPPLSTAQQTNHPILPFREPWSPTDILMLVRLNAIRAHYLTLQGDPLQALQVANYNLSLGQLISESHDPTMSDLLVGHSIKLLGVATLDHILPLIDDHSVLDDTLIESFDQYRYSSQPLINYLHSEATKSEAVLQTFETNFLSKKLPDSFSQAHTSNFLYKPNQTRALLFEHFTALIDYLESDDYQGLEIYEQQALSNPHQLMLFVDGNVMGKLWISRLTPVLKIHEQYSKLVSIDSSINELQDAIRKRRIEIDQS